MTTFYIELFSDIRSVRNIYAAMALSYIVTSSPIAFTITFILRWKTINGLEKKKVSLEEERENSESS